MEGKYFYPDAIKWMWNYCEFLGKFTDSKGVNWDLGVHIDDKWVVGAIVDGNEPGDYYSPCFSVYKEGDYDNDDMVFTEAYLETIKRAKKKKLLL